jgi:hypothetical protein
MDRPHRGRHGGKGENTRDPENLGLINELPAKITTARRRLRFTEKNDDVMV